MSAYDDELVRRWRGEGCPACEHSLAQYGMLSTKCSVCGVDRSSNSVLWREIVRRGLVERAGVSK